MATITANKAWGNSFIAWQQIAPGQVIISSSSGVPNARAAAFDIRVGRSGSTVYKPGWPNIRIEGQNKSGGHWTPLYIYQMGSGGSPNSLVAATFSGACSAGATNFKVTGAGGMLSGDIIFLGHTTTASNYELARVVGLSATTGIYVEEAVANAHDAGAPISNQAEMVFPVIGIETFNSIRVVVDNVGNALPFTAQVLCSTYDSDTSA